MLSRNIVNVYARIPVNQAQFTKNGKSVDTVKGHETVDLTLTLELSSPGVWHLGETRNHAARRAEQPASVLPAFPRARPRPQSPIWKCASPHLTKL